MNKYIKHIIFAICTVVFFGLSSLNVYANEVAPDYEEELEEAYAYSSSAHFNGYLLNESDNTLCATISFTIYYTYEDYVGAEVYDSDLSINCYNGHTVWVSERSYGGSGMEDYCKVVYTILRPSGLHAKYNL